MRLNLSKWDEAQWFKMGDDQDDPEFLIRPYPASLESFAVRQGGEMVITGEMQWKRFEHCLADWRGILDANGSPLPCSKQVKREIYDARAAGIVDFVISKARELETVSREAEKN